MKQITVPITILVFLIVILVIIDRKEFNRTAETTPTMETTGVNQKTEGKPNICNDVNIITPLGPIAVPISTPQEAIWENEKAIASWQTRHNIRIEEEKRGQIFYRELFERTEPAYNRDKYPNRNIFQTNNWKLIQNESISDNSAAIKKENCFEVKSSIPLVYRFSQPLLENRMYCYAIGCIAEGEGSITFCLNGSNKTKAFNVKSDSPAAFFFELGEANTLNTKITPEVRIQGNLQIESITVYKKLQHKDRTVCLGRIEEISNVPDIEKANYPDCFYTAKFVANQILDGEPVPQNIQLLIPAFRDNKIDPLSSLVQKGSWRVAIRAFSSAPRSEQEIEQVDEIDSFLFTPYILIDAVVDNAEKQTGSIPFSDGNDYVSPYDHIINSPIKQYKEDSILAINKELVKVNGILESLDDDIERINQAFQLSWNKTQQQYDVLTPATIWAQERNSFFTLPATWDFIHPKKIKDSNVDAIKELNDLLKLNHVQLIVQVVPDYYDIAALVLNPEFKKYGDQQSAVVVKQLLEKGIETQYLSDSFVENAFNYERLFFYPNDYHPDEGGADIITDCAANRLKQFGDVFPKEFEKSLFSTEYHDTGAGDNLKWPLNCHIGQHKAGTNVQTSYIYYNHKKISSDQTSKILLLGNSFTQEPFRDAYLSYLTSKMLYKIHGETMNGVSLLTSLPNILLINFEEYLKGKLAVLLPVSISLLVNDDYSFFNVKDADSLYTQTEASELVFSLSPQNNSSAVPVLSSNFTFNSFFQSFLADNTGIVSLSKNNPEITMDIPNDENVSTITLSVAPWRGVKACLSINGQKFNPSTAATPAWQIISCPLSPDCKTISIRLDLDDSSPNAGVFIGSISGYK